MPARVSGGRRSNCFLCWAGRYIAEISREKAKVSSTRHFKTSLNMIVPVLALIRDTGAVYEAIVNNDSIISKTAVIGTPNQWTFGLIRGFLRGG
jgi:hypothetical protein